MNYDPIITMLVNLIVLTGASVLTVLIGICRYKYQLVKSEGVYVKQIRAVKVLYTQSVMTLIWYSVMIVALIKYGPLPLG